MFTPVREEQWKISQYKRAEWLGKILYYCIYKFIFVDFLRSFKPCTSVKKRPVGRPKKSIASTVTGASVAVTNTSVNYEEENAHTPPAKKIRGHYRTYSLNFKISVVRELHQLGAQVGDVSEKFTFEGLFQLEQEGSRRCNTMSVLTLYLYKCLSNGRPLNSEDGR